MVVIVGHNKMGMLVSADIRHRECQPNISLSSIQNKPSYLAVCFAVYCKTHDRVAGPSELLISSISFYGAQALDESKYPNEGDKTVPQLHEQS